jgi:hypothetical protein
MHVLPVTACVPHSLNSALLQVREPQQRGVGRGALVGPTKGVTMGHHRGLDSYLWGQHTHGQRSSGIWLTQPGRHRGCQHWDMGRGSSYSSPGVEHGAVAASQRSRASIEATGAVSSKGGPLSWPTTSLAGKGRNYYAGERQEQGLLR